MRPLARAKQEFEVVTTKMWSTGGRVRGGGGLGGGDDEGASQRAYKQEETK
jgi:hypothetical protein